jgi:CheY-like chemotaxis protein
MRASVRDLLSPMYTVEAVSDGEQVLNAARRERPDLIIANTMMPQAGTVVTAHPHRIMPLEQVSNHRRPGAVPGPVFAAR